MFVMRTLEKGDGMPPRTKFDKEMILSVAFEILASEGLDGITARSVADKLDSSVGPIYTSFGSIDELKKAAMKKGADLLFDYISRNRTGNAMLDKGMGSVLFARDHPVLYQELLVFGKNYPDLQERFFERVADGAGPGGLIRLFPEEEQERMLEKMAVFTQGLAFQASLGLQDDDSNEYIMNMLVEMGFDILRSTALKLGMPIEQFSTMIGEEHEGDSD
jgi:AcrR family transcriptional regulator